MDVVMDDIEKTSVNDVLYDFVRNNCEIDEPTRMLLEQLKNKCEATQVREELRQTSQEAAELSKTIIKNLPSEESTIK